MRWDLGMMERGEPAGLDVPTEPLRSMAATLGEAVSRVNCLTQVLRSPVLDLVGLKEAIQAHAEEVQEWAGIEMRLNVKWKLEKRGRFLERDIAIFPILWEATSRYCQLEADACRLRG